jgi:hypothetical protein
MADKTKASGNMTIQFAKNVWWLLHLCLTDPVRVLYAAWCGIKAFFSI